ncbi:hypothetical protein D3C87_764870 [compost metagenome]
MKTLGSVNGTANRYEFDTDKGRIEVYANTLEEAKRVAGLAGFTVAEDLILSEDEKALIEKRRKEQAERDELMAFREKAVNTAAAWLAWSKEGGDGLTFSTFINQFEYQDSDGRKMYMAVSRILEAALEFAE